MRELCLKERRIGEQGSFSTGLTDELHSDREPVRGKSAWDRDCRASGHSDRQGKPQPRKEIRQRYTFHVHHVTLSIVERRYHNCRGYQEIARLKERGHATVQFGARQFSKRNLARCVTQSARAIVNDLRTQLVTVAVK
jgi:hypothetical protein